MFLIYNQGALDDSNTPVGQLAAILYIGITPYIHAAVRPKYYNSPSSLLFHSSSTTPSKPISIFSWSGDVLSVTVMVC